VEGGGGTSAKIVIVLLSQFVLLPFSVPWAVASHVDICPHLDFNLDKLFRPLGSGLPDAE
jgi:hypothetical protein